MTKAVVVHPIPLGGEGLFADPAMAPAFLAEAVRLAQALDLEIVDSVSVPLRRTVPATLLGVGALETLSGIITHHEATLLVMNADLSPTQQRNLEKKLEVKVLDRTALILEIFGARAQTKEGTLQVELAALTYQKSRLVRSWTHLERQRGGLGFIGGPGESQIELDRRMIRQRIKKIEKQLETVKRTRAIQRKARKRVPYPVVALVGYTNAGKSTLFNRLTQSDIFAKDMLFATLDPTMRALKLPGGRQAILSDTVGFISNLPHNLVAAFQATLEEVVEADVLLHVQDASAPDQQIQAREVEKVLESLGIDVHQSHKIIEVYNKIDLLSDEDRLTLKHTAARMPNACCVSAKDDQGITELCERIANALSSQDVELHLEINSANGAEIAWVYQKGQVITLTHRDDKTHITCRLPRAELPKVSKQGFKIL